MTSTEDLRTEKFHEAGVKAVGDITPYDVTVAWDTLAGVKGGASVQVGMPISGLSQDDAFVREAVIRGARSDAVVTAVVNKLVAFSEA